jgi:lipopolysaccharide transport system ATP-binding protein
MQQDHVTHCWYNDVLVFKSHSSSVQQGLVGIPMLEIELTTVS